MHITQTHSAALARGFNVKLDAQEIDKKVNEKLQDIGKNLRMPGFRPGKAPMALLKSKYGKAVMGEVLEAAVNDSVTKIIAEHKLRPALRPKIEVKVFDEAQGLEYDMTIELLPEIAVADVEGITLEKLTAKPDAKAVKEAMDRLARVGRITEKVEDNRAAAMGDVLVIDFDGTVDGKAFPGMKGEAHELELGSKSFIDTFEEQLVGAKAGDEKTVEVSFPKDYHQASLSGVKAVFKVSVKELRQPVIPVIDDEYAKKLGVESLAELEETLEKSIQIEYDQIARMNLKRALLDALDEKHDFEVPAGMVEAEFNNILHQVYGHAHDQAGHVHGPDCAHEHGTEEERAEFHDIAERRVKLGLVLAEIGRLNKIEVTNQDLQHAVVAEARRHPGREREVFDHYTRNAQALEGLKAPVYEDKVVDFVLEKAKIADKQVGVDELIQASEQEPPKKAKKAGKK